MNKIECLEPIYLAWERMLLILFQPFSIGKWLVMGFTAWLAHLFQGWGGSGFNFNLPTNFSNFKTAPPPRFPPTQPVPPKSLTNISELTEGSAAFQNIENLFDKITNNPLGLSIGILILLLITCIVIGIIIGIVLLWIRARGEFMFLDNVVCDCGAVASPWKTYKDHGNSLFIWNLFLSLCSTFIVFLILLLTVLLCLPWVKSCFKARNFFAPDTSAILGIVFLFLSIIISSILFSIIFTGIKHFVVPVMYKQNVMFLDGARIVIELFKNNMFAFIKFFIVLFILNIVASIAITIICFLTCCIGFFVLGLPYIWAVVTLPLLVFFRLYSLEFISQFGDEFNFRPQPEEEVTA